MKRKVTILPLVQVFHVSAKFGHWFQNESACSTWRSGIYQHRKTRVRSQSPTK